MQIRTFNTAPLNTTHSSIFTTNPELLSQFVNYRLDPDVVSNLPLQNYTGNTFVFPCDQDILASHRIKAVTKSLPAEILDQQVGNPSELINRQDMLLESIRGVLHSYQCRVEGQFFSRFRAGSKNLDEFKKMLPLVINAISTGKYDQALSKLKALDIALDGATSKDMVKALVSKVKELKICHNKEVLNPAQEELRRNQRNMQSALQEYRANEQAKNTITEDVQPTASPGG